jgi:hypothetical protein
MYCIHCGDSESELRAYGPGGSWVCFKCAFSTPERKKQTENAFVAVMEAEIAATGMFVIGLTP